MREPSEAGPAGQDAPSSQDPSSQDPSSQDPSSQDPSTQDPSTNSATEVAGASAVETWFDHLVIAAGGLDAAQAWSRAVFGVALPQGGAHPGMATHNLLARLPEGYLEAIAVNPSARPTRARWYGLDDAALQTALAAAPRPVAWVLATRDLDAAVAALAESGAWDPGEIVEARRGDLRWRITVPADGAPPEQVAPTLIEWPASIGGSAPVDRMGAPGLELRRLLLRHPNPQRIAAGLAALGGPTFTFDVDIEAAAPSLRRPAITAELLGPQGAVVTPAGGFDATMLGG